MDWLQQILQTVVFDWGPSLLDGALVTLQISAGAFAVGLCLGLLVALIKLTAPRPLVLAANLYTSLCRAVPELLLILLLYYAGGDLINFILAQFDQGPAPINGFMAAVVVLGIVQGAYASEILRGAIQAVPAGHIEAARAFGCGRLLVLRRIILPEMLPNALGGLSNLWLTLIKDSALISVVGYSELLFTTKQAAGSTREYLLFYVAVSLIYLLMTLLSNLLFTHADRRIARWMPAH